MVKKQPSKLCTVFFVSFEDDILKKESTGKMEQIF